MTEHRDVAAAGSARRLLVIDDNATYLTLMVRIMHRAGWAVVSTRDPREAMTLFEEMQPDLVLVDFRMPNLDGFAVAEQIRAALPGDRTPIILMTGDPPCAVEESAGRHGIAAVLGKPFTSKDVLACIGKLRVNG